eukprot:790004-Pyramimonas_sp.AAC.3
MFFAFGAFLLQPLDGLHDAKHVCVRLPRQSDHEVQLHLRPQGPGDQSTFCIQGSRGSPELLVSVLSAC